ncbi:fibronectin type III domain-containing protein [Joostella sp.]|uniref:fibronectin type III domain-containing protein n=1 Tax=Joostella sp. TaxID=2231138 RepID=UPI003A8F97BB
MQITFTNAFFILKKNSFFLMVLLWMLSTISGWAQVYPVQVNTQMNPPYSLKLSDYATSQSEKIITNILLTDVNEFNRQLRFRFSIKGNGVNIRSNDMVIGAAPVFIDGGVPLRLTNLDLKPYFELQNLQGISPQQYNNPLPDGMYQFCFEVFDWVSGQRLSNPNLGCFNAFLIINDPPFLNLPRKGDLIEAKNPQNVLFNWTPRHLNANNVQYEFELREIWDTKIDPQASFLASPNLYQTTTRNNTLLYGPGETTLLENKTYAWRVRALVSDGISEASVFRNNGYSEIFYFTYTADCQSPQFVLAKSLSANSEEITWQPNVDHQGYNVQYRKKGVRDAVWFEANAVNSYTKLYNLEAGTTYEFRVGGQCMLPIANSEPRYSYSSIQEFTTPIKTEDNYYNCGIAPEISITNKKPLDAIGANDVFTAGDFPVTIKRVEPNGNGSFSGIGFIVVPYLADTKIAVEFDNIKINTDYQLYQGSLYTTYDLEWSNEDDTSDEFEAVAEIPNAIGELGDIVTELLNLDIDKATREQIKNLTESFVEGVKNEDLPAELATSLTEAANDFEEKGLDVKDADDELKEAQELGDEEAIKQAEKKLNTAKESFNQAQDNLNDVNKEREEYLEQFSDIVRKAITEIYREYKEMELENAYFSQLDNFTVLDNQEDISVVGAKSDVVVLDIQMQDTDYETVQTKQYDEALRRLSIYYICKLVIEDSESDYYNQFIVMAKANGSDLFKLAKTELDSGKVEREVIPIIKEEIIKATSKIMGYNG